MKLEKGDIVKTERSDNTMVLDVKDNTAVLFDNHQFILASGMDFNKESGVFEWENARYANDISTIANMKNTNLDMMKETLSFLAEYNHEDFVKGIISLETGIEQEEVLSEAYDNYMNDKAMGLVDEKFYDFIDENYPERAEMENTNEEKEQTNDNKEQKESTVEKKTGKEKEADKRDDPDTINIHGNIASDIKIKNLKSKEGKDFTVASFSVAENDKEGNVKFTNCLAYNEKADRVQNFKKGDFVHLFGKETTSFGKDGKEYTHLKVYSAKLLKAKEQSKQNRKEKSSVMGKLQGYKEKAQEQTSGGQKKSKNMER